MTRFLNTLTILAMAAASMTTTGFAAPVVHDQLNFKVTLNDQEIGHHNFTILRQGENSEVRVEAKFDVRFFFIKAYSYLHQNTETWHGKCLARIDSTTDDNGERFELIGGQLDDAFTVLTTGDARSLKQGCIMTFAYWDPDFLTQTHLLNAQTGEYTRVSINPLGERVFELNGSKIKSNGYRIVSEKGDLDIGVWYQQKVGRWLALESRIDDEKVLRYLPTSMSAL